jgi:urease beta subunit
MDEYTGLKFEVWSSTPAVLWTADRPQELGIHVHIYEKGRRLVDDTFGRVIYQGQELDRKILWQEMAKNTIY